MTLHELLVEEIKDLYHAEKQLTKALPKMAKAATHDDLRAAYESHLEETRGLLQEDADGSVLDAGLIAAAQRAEHDEIFRLRGSGCGARLLGQDEAASLLEQTLEEEKAADEKLSSLAESEINQSALAEGSEEAEEDEEEGRGTRRTSRRQMAGSRSRSKAADRRRRK